MSANPIDKKSTPNPTGSLEDLFRHHLGEEAAAPPRALLWDQIDNSLLMQQNETYRRRLAATRWVAAASLLLAMLAGTGWWATRYAGIGSPEVARTAQLAGPATGTTAPGEITPPAYSARRVATTGRSAATSPTSPVSNPANRLATSATAVPDSPAATATAGRYPGSGSAAAPTDLTGSVATSGGKARRSGFGRAAPQGRGAALGTFDKSKMALAARGPQHSSPNTERNAATSPAAMAAAPARRAWAIGGRATAVAEAATVAAGVVPGSATAAATPAEPLPLLAAHPATLNLTTPAALPKGLALDFLTTAPTPALPVAAHKWNYGGSYTASTFNPNVNFSRDGLGAEYRYNPALGPDSPALTEAAAAEYRANLRPGLSQRLALLATRHLAGHWSLRTGAELGQATAKSVSSAGFLGEQLYDLGAYSTGPERATAFRYRLASIPVELRYANPAKRGWSLYGRLGGVVSALLGVRSEVDGNPEATRTYSILSAGTPYRRVLGSLRGGAGMQFRPGTGNWALTLGPVAELGLVPLNAHPAQSYLAQSRPYSFGMEAGMEFGR